MFIRLGRLTTASAPASTTARLLRIGAAGYVRGLDIANDDTVVCYTDSYGAYIWDPNATSLGNAGGLGSWRQLISTATISSSDPGVSLSQAQTFSGSHGCYETRLCKNDSNYIWLGFQGYLYKSSNKGVSFTRVTTPFTPASQPDMNANDGSLQTNNAGPKLAIDPINPNVVYFGLLSNRPWYTFDGGSNWTQIGSGSMAAPSSGRHTAIAIDQRVSTQSGGVSTRGFFGVEGTGVYISTNLGSGTPTFTKISGTGTSNTTLTRVNRMIVDSQGSLWVVDYTFNTNNIWRYDTGGAWTQFNFTGAGISGQYMNSIAEDRTVASGARMVAFSDQLVGMLTNNAQNATPTWSGGFFPDNSVGSRVATDCPALAYMTPDPTVGEVQVDSTGRAWLATGIGVFTATVPNTFATSFNWTSRNSGIEGLTTNLVALSPNNKAVTASWDRALYVSDLSTYPTTVQPQSFTSPPGATSADWASADTNTFVGLFFDNIYIYNGSSWTTRTAGLLVSGGRSAIAAASATNFMWMPNGLKPQYTTNAGVTWNDLGSYFSSTFSITSDIFLNSRDQPVCADRVGSNTFYMHYAGCIFRSTNSGASWSKMSTDGVASGIPTIATALGGNHMLRAVNGRQGHLIFCGGQTYQGTPYVHPQTADSQCYISTDGGATWADLSSNVRDVWGIDTGPQVGTYPRIWLWGWVNTGSGFSPGYWYSDNQGTTWTKQVTDLFDGRFDTVNWVEAHKTDATKFLVAFEGSGFGLYG